MTWECLECGAANPDANAWCGSRICQHARAAMADAGAVRVPGAGVLGSETVTPKPRQRKQHSYTPEFEEFWSVYVQIRNKDKYPASKAYATARTLVDAKTLRDGAEAYRIETADRAADKRKHAATWLNARGWEDGKDADLPVKSLYSDMAAVGSPEWQAQRDAEERKAMA